MPRLWDVTAVRYDGKTLDSGATDVSCAGNVGLPSKGTEPADKVTENFPQLFGGENGDPMVLYESDVLARRVLIVGCTCPPAVGSLS